MKKLILLVLLCGAYSTQSMVPQREITQTGFLKGQFCTTQGLKEVAKINNEVKTTLNTLLRERNVAELTPRERARLDEELEKIWCGPGFMRYWESQAI
jgi:hypothetical protein